MKTADFKCDKCGAITEVEITFAKKLIKVCPSCLKGRLTRIYQLADKSGGLTKI